MSLDVNSHFDGFDTYGPCNMAFNQKLIAMLLGTLVKGRNDARDLEREWKNIMQQKTFTTYKSSGIHAKLDM